MSTQLLKDKVIFLTGGSTGIGFDCAKAYAAEGANVVLVARGKDAVEKSRRRTRPAASRPGVRCLARRRRESGD